MKMNTISEAKKSKSDKSMIQWEHCKKKYNTTSKLKIHIEHIHKGVRHVCDQSKTTIQQKTTYEIPQEEHT